MFKVSWKTMPVVFMFGVLAALGLRQLVILGFVDVSRLMDLGSENGHTAEAAGSALGIAMLTAVPFAKQIMGNPLLIIVPNIAICCGYSVVWPFFGIWSAGICAMAFVTSLTATAVGILLIAIMPNLFQPRDEHGR